MRGDFDADRDELLLVDFLRRIESSSLLSSELELDELSDELLLLLDDVDESDELLLLSLSELDVDDCDDSLYFDTLSLRLRSLHVEDTSFFGTFNSLCESGRICADDSAGGSFCAMSLWSSGSVSGDATCWIKLSYSSMYCFIFSSDSIRLFAALLGGVLIV